MSRFLDLGLGISIINVYYSLTYFLMWCVELDDNRNAGGGKKMWKTSGMDGLDRCFFFFVSCGIALDNNEPFVWLAVYVLNLLLNVFLFLGLRKRDRLAIVIWFSLTLAWLVAKLMDHKRGCRLDGRGSMYRLLNALLEGMWPSDTVCAFVYIFYMASN